MSDIVLVLMIVIAIAVGWVLGRYERYRVQKDGDSDSVTSGYFKGLNYLLDEKPEEAIDTFVKALEVDSGSVETHLSMGSLYRKRGEVDRATKLHQSLLARPDLSAYQQELVKLELARDYVAVGLLDRAENLLLELSRQKKSSLKLTAVEHLLSIYEQEREWSEAINAAETLFDAGRKDCATTIAHFYCESAEEHLREGDRSQAKKIFKKALSRDKACVRAYLKLADIEFETKHVPKALYHLKTLQEQRPDFLPEALPLLKQCFEARKEPEAYVALLSKSLETKPMMPVILALAEEVEKQQGADEASKVIFEFIKREPSVRGLHQIIEMQLAKSQGQAKENLEALQLMTRQLLSQSKLYECQHCGFGGRMLHWQCPRCKTWGSTAPV